MGNQVILSEVEVKGIRFEFYIDSVHEICLKQLISQARTDIDRAISKRNIF